MPFVNITHAKDALTIAQKRSLMTAVQDAVVAVEGESMRVGIAVALEEAIQNPEFALNCLPFVRVTLVRDALTAEQRAEMASRIVEAVVAVEGEARRNQVWVVIEESVASGEWSIGGNSLTLAALEAIKAGRNPWVLQSSTSAGQSFP